MRALDLIDVEPSCVRSGDRLRGVRRRPSDHGVAAPDLVDRAQPPLERAGPASARDHRVITIDGRGNGASGRPVGGAAYVPDQFVADIVAVLDETETDLAVVVGVSFGGLLALLLVAHHPGRVVGTCFIAATVPFAEVGLPRILRADFDAEQDSYDGWEQVNRHAWRRDYARFLEFFFEHCFTEPHSTKPRRRPREVGTRHDPGNTDQHRRGPAARGVPTHRRADAPTLRGGHLPDAPHPRRRG